MHLDTQTSERRVRSPRNNWNPLSIDETQSSYTSNGEKHTLMEYFKGMEKTKPSLHRIQTSLAGTCHLGM